ncbi:ABC transporter substrate-binding protein [Streptosporangium sp. NPDC006013]|uniref:ABC transporter substrate-binding protein n=1 Tax=Streptosporangium sp. NPDC006013 TaxID=3155596 RepID=UPI0033A43E62
MTLSPLAACAGPGTVTGTGGTSGGAGGQGLTLALNRSLVSLDNKLNQFDAAVSVQRGVRQALTFIDPKLAVQNVLAESFELTAPTEWTVRLRDGVRYSDGSPVTVEDVSTALEMYQKVPGSFLAGFFPEWPKVTPVDKSTFKLVSENPMPTLDYLMANILITPAAANKPEELQDGVGSGPYVVTSASRGTGEYTLQVNDKYWGPAPAIKTVRVRFLPEEAGRIVSLRSGEVDVIDAISPDAIAQLSGLADVEVQEVPGTRICQLFYNFRKPSGHPLADARVREALTYAINGPSLVKDVFSDSVTPMRGVVAGTLAGAAETGEYVYDPRKARQLLDAAGVKDLTLKIIWETGEFVNDTSVMEAVVEMLKAVGVRAELQQFQPGGDISKWRQGRAGDWDVLGNGYGTPTGLALTPLQGMYAGTAEKEASRDTYQGYVFPKITTMVEKASQEADQAKRERLLADAQKEIWNTWPCLWAFTPKTVIARRKHVQNLQLGPTNSYDLATVRLSG